jgi:hypothetical protein
MSIANVDLRGFAGFPNEIECPLGVGDGGSCSPTCHHFIPIDSQDCGNVVETEGVLPLPPFGDSFLLTDAIANGGWHGVVSPQELTLKRSAHDSARNFCDTPASQQDCSRVKA